MLCAPTRRARRSGVEALGTRIYHWFFDETPHANSSFLCIARELDGGVEAAPEPAIWIALSSTSHEPGKKRGNHGVVRRASAEFEVDVCVVGGCGHVGLPILLAHRVRVAINDIDTSAVEMVSVGTNAVHGREGGAAARAPTSSDDAEGLLSQRPHVSCVSCCWRLAPIARRCWRFWRMTALDTVFHYVPLHNSRAGRRYGRANGDLIVTCDLSSRLLCMPLRVGLQEADLIRVVDALTRILRFRA